MTGGTVTRVAPGSPGADVGLVVGDVVTSVHGETLTDLVAWLWHTSEDVAIEWLRAEESHEGVLLASGGGTGIEFEGVVFDSIKVCDNSCTFCFVEGLPQGLRPSLYIKDDDYRLSFLSGSFITMTNVSDSDLTRILEQRLSPLYVSLHAIDPGVRRRLLCPTVDDTGLQTLDALLEGGIQAHVQVVLVPGVNDGDVLEETLDWVEKRPGIVSVGVVPVGLTALSKGGLSAVGPDDAKRVISQLETRRSVRFALSHSLLVHAADELYLRAGIPMPAWDEYEGFPQYENGIGLVRAFIDELDEAVLCAKPTERQSVTMVTGESFAPILSDKVETLAGSFIDARVLPVRNEFFGGGVSVAGLLTGSDLVATICEDEAGGEYLVPDILLNDEGLTLDGMSADQVTSESGKSVRFVPADAAGMMDALIGAPRREEPGK